jgi:hypothetical protein
MLRRTTMGGGQAQVQQLLVLQSATTQHRWGGNPKCNNSKIILKICNKNSENRQNSTEIHRNLHKK